MTYAFKLMDSLTHAISYERGRVNSQVRQSEHPQCWAGDNNFSKKKQPKT